MKLAFQLRFSLSATGQEAIDYLLGKAQFADQTPAFWSPVINKSLWHG